MALIPKISYEQQCNCVDSLLNETTGTYDALTNPGGYGAPNVASTAIIQAVFTLKKSEWDTPITLTFTISSGTIIAATRTDFFGNVADVLALLSNTAFPLVNQVIDSKILFGTLTKEELESGSYYCTYSVTDGVDTYSTVLWSFFVCAYDSCVEEAIVKKAKGQITQEKALDIYYNYDALYVFVGLQQPTDVQAQMEILDALCSECGCCKNINQED
jgi:hypothetical protein